MDNQTKVSMISDNDIATIKQLIPTIIKKTFTSLPLIEQEIIAKHLTNLVLITSLFFYTDKSTFLQQITINGNRDIFSLLVLLMPFYDLNTSSQITSLEELFHNKGGKTKQLLASSFYVDHEGINVDDYFATNFRAIYDSYLICQNKLCYNWLNIFPYTMETIRNSPIHDNFTNKWLSHTFSLTAVPMENIFDVTISSFSKTTIQNHQFLLGYDTLYGCFYKFLYHDIKTIKWMIYDLIYDDKMLPTIIVLSEIIPIRQIANTHFKDLTKEQVTNLQNTWKTIINNDLDTKYTLMKSLLLFYLRWERDETKLELIDKQLDSNCKQQIKTHIDSAYDDDTNESFFYDKTNVAEIDKCLKHMMKTVIDVERLYEYIYICMQQFRYTWYGFVCLDEEVAIRQPMNYLETYCKNKVREFTAPVPSPTSSVKIFTITPKNIYGFVKNLIHSKITGKFAPYSSFRFSALMKNEQDDFINKLNDRTASFYNIENNIRNLEIVPDTGVRTYMNNLRTMVSTTNIIPLVVLETLIYNGILTYTKYNPIITDDNVLPNKQTQGELRKDAVYAGLEIKRNLKAYLFWDNKLLEKHPEYEKNTGKSFWYTNFGSDWLAQTQIFHHFINQRVLFITGGTGAGKSTITPFMMVYALKITDYNNNGKVFCTQPRIQPVVGNATWISFQLGIPIKKSDGFYTGESINYVQYKHGEKMGKSTNSQEKPKANADAITDDYYHPTLRLITDGSLYNSVKSAFIYKKQSNANSDKMENKFTATNIFDVLLVDEAHEHNIYMDLILTLAKFATYINNQITLGIISATMDTDEIIYRKYYKCIDDNWKYPITASPTLTIGNRQSLDRRIHLSVPFGSMNYAVTDIQKSPPDNEMTVLTHILNTTMKGDVLIFQAGSGEIKKLVKQINENTKKDVYAIPFYSELDQRIMNEIVKEIQKENIRNNFRLPKNVPIEEYYTIKEEQKVPRGTYKRFVLVATNIAEASITIDSLKFVIDTVWQKTNIFDIDTNSSKLTKTEISKSNSTQRRGRVGRASTGTCYRLYDFNKLRDRVDYKICISDIKTEIFALLTTTSNGQYFLTHDPYKTSGRVSVKFLSDQYKNSQLIPFNKLDTETIVYPHDDGKYTTDDLEDVSGKFFIVSPDEDDLIRANTYDLQITGKMPNYVNRVFKIMEYFQKIGLRQVGTNRNTVKGELIDAYMKFIDNEKIKLEHLLMFIDCVTLTNDENVINKIILFIVLMITNVTVKSDATKRGFADFLVKASVIPDGFYNRINVDNIASIVALFNDTVTNVNSVIQDGIVGLKLEYQKLAKPQIDIDGAFEILTTFYTLKIKLMFLTNNHLINKYLIDSGNADRKQDVNPNITVLKKIIGYNNEILKTIVLSRPMSEYEFSAYVIAKNYPNNILLKVQGTDYYVGYFDRDINVFYEINSFTMGGRTVYTTSVDEMFRNNVILHIPNPLNTANMVSNIMMIPMSVIEILRKTIEVKRNAVIDNDKINNVFVSRNVEDTADYNAFISKIGEVKRTVEMK